MEIVSMPRALLKLVITKDHHHVWQD